jgi:GWxTD domain-containing protein
MSNRSRVIVLASALLALFAMPGRAELSQIYQDWAAGPAQILMTKTEIAEWSRIATDADAENFVRLFWARRDPTPDSAENEFRQDFERRAAYADQRFAEKTERGEEVRGSLSDRGRVFILLGPPRRLQRPGAGGVSQGGDFGFGEGAPGGGEPRAAREGPGRGGIYEGAGVASEEIWVYEDDKKPDVIKKKRAQIRFRTQPGSEEVKLYQAEEALAYMAEAVDRAIVRPDLTLADLAPASPAVAATAGGFGAWGAEVVAEPATVEALTAALAGPAKAGPDAHLDASPFQASDGTWVLPVQVSLAGSPPAGATLVGELIDPASGEAKVAFRGEKGWEESKGQQALKATVLAPPGSYELRAGLSGPSGDVLWSGTARVEVPAPTDDFWISNLILSDNIFPMSHPQEMYEPYAWQGIVVVPKGGRTFPQGDVLWFYVHACQPQLAEDGKPNLRLSMVLSGPAEFRGPVGVNPVKAGDHCWVLAQGLDLVADRFPPGDYQMKVNVRDSTAGKTLVSGTDFKIVPATGG